MTPLPILCYTADKQQENPDGRFEDLKHQFELLENKVEADMKVSQAHREQAKAENDSAFERLRADMERHNAEQNAKMERYNAEQGARITEQSARITEQNTKMAEQAEDMVKFIATMSVGIVVVLGGFIAFLQFYK